MMKKLILCVLLGLSIAGSSIYAQPTSPALQKVVHSAEMTGSGTNVAPLGLTNTCSSGQVLAWNGSSWACAAGSLVDATQIDTTISGLTNNYALTSTTQTLVLRPAASGVQLTGIAAPSANWRRIHILNDSNQCLSIYDDNGNSTITNRIKLQLAATGFGYLCPGAEGDCIYDPNLGSVTPGRWSCSIKWGKDSPSDVVVDGNLTSTGTLGVTGGTTLNGSLTIGSGNAVIIGSATTFNSTAPVTVSQFLGTAISPSTTGTLNDWAPTNLSLATIVYAVPSAATRINGITGGSAGREIWLYNNSASFNITLSHEDAGSTPADRITMTAGVSGLSDLVPTCAVHLRYNGTTSRWVEDVFSCWHLPGAVFDQSVTASAGILTNSVAALTGAGAIAIGTANTGGITIGQAGNSIAINGPTTIMSVVIANLLVTIDNHITIGSASKNRIVTVIDSSQRPTIAGCGTGATIAGGDYSFLLTTGTTPGGSCVVTFQNTASANASCTLTARDGVSKGYSVSTTALTINGVNALVKYDGSCVSH